MSNLKTVGISFCITFSPMQKKIVVGTLWNFSDFNISFRVNPDRGTPPRFFLNMDADGYG